MEAHPTSDSSDADWDSNPVNRLLLECVQAPSEQRDARLAGHKVRELVFVGGGAKSVMDSFMQLEDGGRRTADTLCAHRMVFENPARPKRTRTPRSTG